MNKRHTKQSGFVALMTAIVLSLIIILITATLNQSGFFARYIALDSEYKEMSVALAEACIDNAILRIISDETYGGNETLRVGDEICTIRPVQIDAPSAGMYTIETQAAFNEATTNLRVVIDGNDYSIESWTEVQSF
ncbi:MAG: hypothetical protein COV34_02800 [Candidatus Zambryskibacteria bacterium CG10_big_fil_rev_8_21_14_0_10_42_12]|uniref:Type 4 fimbrial biogenesis protein PilX N-terminal domain-containing protein n=1 Tax=Candidatus Zambryskibacteria bacterium CG10_big_fil_rev_8_21_14_0_10_42_12 TaxID=1975115 RepID=A0A2H0QUN3_9BACT|nr:MAG: hypothetical protein COV34_02800 [Candidatus Zambryskibacteria bacterium CG10_big_fil_rev_8_21_14_0_10_42_12]